MNAHLKHFDKNYQYINLLVHDKKLSKKYNEIRDSYLKQ